MARQTTKTAPNAAVSTKTQRAAGIRLPDGSKLVGVLFNSDMVTVLGFVVQSDKGGYIINTTNEFAMKVRISDYVDAYGRCNPRKLREFQSRDGGSLPYSRVLRIDNKTQVKLDPKNVTADQLNTLLGSGAFTPLPDYALVKGLIRRASTQDDAQSGKYVTEEGLVGINLLLHYPSMPRKKKVKDAAGNVKLVPITVKEHTVEKFLPVYDAYSLPFEVKKYAIKHTSVKTAVGATTALYNYYVSIKKDSIPAANPATEATLTLEQKATMLLSKETAPKYNPGFDPELVQAMYLMQTDIDNFRNNGVFIKGANLAAPVSAIKSSFTADAIFDIEEDETLSDTTAETAAPAEAPSVDEDAVVGDAPAFDAADDVVVATEDTVVAPEPEPSEDDIMGLFDGVTFVDAPTVGGDGDLSTPIDRGITLPAELKASNLLTANDAKILAEARQRWENLCLKLQEVADEVAKGTPYSYGEKESKTLESPAVLKGLATLILEDTDARRVSIKFGNTKAGSKYPLLTMNSINLVISRKFYATLCKGVENIPVVSPLSNETLTLYAFDGRDAGAKGFGIDLPSGHFTSSDIYDELKAISKLMHAISDDLVQTNLTLTFINAGNAAVWRQSLKAERRDLGLNAASVARAESLEYRISQAVNAMDSVPDVKKPKLRSLALNVAFTSGDLAQKCANFDNHQIAYDPVTSEYRNGGGNTRSEWELAKKVARVLENLANEDGNVPYENFEPAKGKSVTELVAAQRARENGTAWDNDARSKAVAAAVVKSDVEKKKEETLVSDDFNWADYEGLRAYIVAATSLKEFGKPEKASSSTRSLAFDMHLNGDDIEGMKASGVSLAKESPILIHAEEKLDSNVKAMLLWLLGTVGVGQNTNDGLQFVGGDDDMPGLWTDKSKATRAGAATHTSNYEYVAKTTVGENTFGASLVQPV